MKTPTAALLLLLCAAPASATPILTVSWDGNPPGNLSQLTGVEDFSISLPPMPAGTWTLTIDGGITAWWDQNRIGTTSAGLLPAGFLGASTFTSPVMWALTATTPSFTAGDSTGPQWAFWLAGNTLHWGLEDISLPGGDADYQDAYGTLTRHRDVVIDPHLLPTVPEPTSWTLVGLGLVALVARRMAR